MWYEDDNFVRVIIELEGVGSLPETAVVSRFDTIRAVSWASIDFGCF
jgi:hypothetical protein